MTLSSSFRRVGFTLGGHVYNQLVLIGVQILLVPVLLHAWGIERYGVWLLLSSIPTYLTFSDFGFTFIAKNEMTMKAAGGDRSGVLVTYQSVFVLLNIITAVVAILAGAVIFAVPMRSIFALGEVSDIEAKLVLALLGASLIFYQYFLLFSGAARAAGRPASEVAWNGTSRLVEGLSTAAVALLGGDLVLAAIIILVNRIVFTSAIFVWIRSIAPWLPIGWSHCSRSEIKRLFNPSISYMFVSVAYALMIQGPITVLGLVTGPDRIAIFSTSRTLARLGTSATNLLNNSVTPEYSHLFGLKKTSGFLRILRFHLALSGAGVLAYLLLMSFLGDSILKLWTGGKVMAEEPFFTLLILSVGAEMIWTALFVPLASTNRHIRVSYAFAILSLIGICACYFGAASYGLTGAILAVLGVNVVMIGVTIEQLISRAGPSALDSAGRGAVKPSQL
ncbi:teichoic acid transporter [Beijerinckiaceae bacterium]|nr:teichoic acid transporter [Beijerinckiaceae bacterium]